MCFNIYLNYNYASNFISDYYIFAIYTYIFKHLHELLYTMTFDSRRMKLVNRPVPRRNFFYSNGYNKRSRDFFNKKYFKIQNNFLSYSTVNRSQNVRIKAITVTSGRNSHIGSISRGVHLARSYRPVDLTDTREERGLEHLRVHECDIDSETMEKLKETSELELNAIDILHTRFGSE